MNTEQIKSLVRHVLTALGTLLVFFGLDRFIPVVETLTLNLDATFQAVEVLIGVVLVVVGFFRNKDRFSLPKND